MNGTNSNLKNTVPQCYSTFYPIETPNAHICSFFCGQDCSLDKLIEEFLDKQENPEQTLTIGHFSWSSRKSAVFIQLYKCLKPDAFNAISLNFFDFEDQPSIIQELVETDQFNSAHQFYLCNIPVDDYFQNFLGFENLNIRVEHFTEKMLLELIDAVKTRNPPIGSQFVITSKKLIEVDTLKPDFQNFEGVLNRLKENQTPQKAVHLTSGSRCLIIIKWSNAIEATVCGWKNWQDDFQKYHGQDIFWIDLY